MKQWAVTNSEGYVIHGFDADQSFVDSFDDRVVEPEHVTVPHWWSSEVVFHEVTGVNPRPVVDFFISSEGTWIDGRPALVAEPVTIPADGSTPSRIIFSQAGKHAPSTVIFSVNEVETSAIPLIGGKASIEVASATVGDSILVTVNDLVVTVSVEGE